MLFGAVIAVVVLKEPLRAVRIAAALLIVCGLVLIRSADSGSEREFRMLALESREVALGVDVPQRRRVRPT